MAQKTALLDQIRGVSFDLDDTFWDCEPAIIHAEQTLHSWLETNHPQTLANHTQESMRQLRADMYKTHPHLATDVTLMRKALLGILFEQHEQSEQLVEQAFAVFYKARSEVVLYEGTHEILQSLQSSHKVAAITNGNANLEQIGLAHYFQDIHCASLDKPPKPATDMFDLCCKNLGIAAHELLHVGDNPQTDVVGGHNAGVRTVWYNQIHAEWPEDLPRADFEVHSLPELQRLLN